MSLNSSEEPKTLFSTALPQINAFIRHLNTSGRILAFCGTAPPSSIPTFAGSGALWRNHKAASLSSIEEAFEANAGLVWSLFADRRKFALKPEVNTAVARLAGGGAGVVGKKEEEEGGGRRRRKKEEEEGEGKERGFVCSTQNIDCYS